MSDWRNNPAKYKDWLEWAMSILPAEKGPQCDHEDTPVGAASRRGTNEAEERDMNLDNVREIWQRHGGGHHGPRVETWDIPEAKMMAFVEELIRAADIHKECKAAYTEALKTQRRQP